MDELMELIKKNGLSKDEVILEAECVEEYGEWINLELMGYPADMLFKAAKLM